MIKYSFKTISLKRISLFCQYSISVYEGISPALLATMSLSQGIKGSNNQQLINSLLKSNIISNKILEKAMKKYDRKLFISQGSEKIKNFYQNKPYRISGGQNMTDVFTHAVILEQACYHLQQKLSIQQNPQRASLSKIRVLDIGSGHGYLSFVISAFLSELQKQNPILYQVIGVDSNQKAIQFSQQLKSKLLSNQGCKQLEQVQLKSSELEDILNESNHQHYDVVIGGFYMPPALHENLISKLKMSSQALNRQVFGIWATDSMSGQSLYSFQLKKDGNTQKIKISKNQIMSTMFSMPVVKTSVSKYFIDEQEPNKSQTQQPIQNQQSSINQEELRQQLKTLKIQKRKADKQKVKQQLRAAVVRHSKLMNRKINLEQMKKIQQINVLLQKLAKL